MRAVVASLLATALLGAGLTAPGPVAASEVDRTATSETMSAPTAERPVRVTGSRAVPRGRWVLSPSGKVLLMHGVNMVYKLDPYAPDEIGFGRDDARFLARQGFTTVRLGLIWKAVEPRPGRYDDAYLARIRRTARILAREGIWTMLDFHQDLYHERFQGEGAPDWAVLDDGLPSQPQLGFPYSYFANLGLNRSFDNFWANAPGPGGVGLQDRFAAAWAHVATYFRDAPRILGLDIFNEPWPGTGWQVCANTVGCPEFDGRLEAFTQRVVDAVRRVDRRTPVWYEPNVLFNNGVPTHVRPQGKGLGFSFHDYCLTADVGAGESTGADGPCRVFNDLVWDNQREHVRATGHTSLLTEFGATTSRTVLVDMVDRAERDLVGWQYWAYCGCDDPTTVGPGATQALVLDPAKPPKGRNIDQRKLKALVRPHPLEVAGTPTRVRFHRGTRILRSVWSTKRADGRGRWGAGARTVIAVPRSVYPKGYRVSSRQGVRVVSRPNAPRLVVEQRRGARQVVVVVRAR